MKNRILGIMVLVLATFSLTPQAQTAVGNFKNLVVNGATWSVGSTCPPTSSPLGSGALYICTDGTVYTWNNAAWTTPFSASSTPTFSTVTLSVPSDGSYATPVMLLHNATAGSGLDTYIYQKNDGSLEMWPANFANGLKINADGSQEFNGSGLTTLNGALLAYGDISLLPGTGSFYFMPGSNTLPVDATLTALRGLWSGTTNFGAISGLNVISGSTDLNAFAVTGYVEQDSTGTAAVGLVGAGISIGDSKGPTFGANLIVSNRSGDTNSHLIGAEIDVSPLSGTTLTGSGALDLRIVSLDGQAYGINLATGGGGGKWSNGLVINDVTSGGAAIWTKSGIILFEDLKTTGSAASKKVVCVDTSNGRLYASSTGTDCSN